MPLLKLVTSEINSFMAYGRTDMPLTVGIETIAACTRKCEYCPVSLPAFEKSRPYRVMKDEVFTSIIDQLATLPGRGATPKGFGGVLHLNGYGEPTIDKKIVERTEYAHKKLPNATIGFYSNGDNLTEDLYLKLRDAGVSEIIITPHDGAFSGKTLALSEKYNEDGIIFLRKPLEKLSNRAGNVSVPDEKHDYPKGRCVHPAFTLELTVDGTAIICCSDALNTEPQGNVAQASITEVWDDPHYRQIRRALKHGRVDEFPDICKKCRSSDHD
jgi:hypothetical protein